MSDHKCDDCGGEIVMIEYHGMDKYHYDGVSEYRCLKSLAENPTCLFRVGRWCGQRLTEKEQEPPYCKGEPHPTIASHP